MNEPELKLSVQRALLGNVTANLAGVSVELWEKEVQFDAYFFEEPTNMDRQYAEAAAAELIADFSEGYCIEVQHKLISTVTLNAIRWNYLRAEAMENRQLDSQRTGYVRP